MVCQGDLIPEEQVHLRKLSDTMRYRCKSSNSFLLKSILAIPRKCFPAAHKSELLISYALLLYGPYKSHTGIKNFKRQRKL